MQHVWFGWIDGVSCNLMLHEKDYLLVIQVSVEASQEGDYNQYWGI